MSDSLGCGGLAWDGRGGCTHEVVEVIGDVPMCLLHRSKVARELERQRRPVAQQFYYPRPPSQRRPKQPASQLPVDDHVVYYLGDPDTQLVKIGNTEKLCARVRAIRTHRPRVVLLATDPGDHRLERRRHRQFGSLRSPLPSGEREWFRKAPVLMDHIGNLRLKHGILAPGGPIYTPWVAPLADGGATSLVPTGSKRWSGVGDQHD